MAFMFLEMVSSVYYIWEMDRVICLSNFAFVCCTYVHIIYKCSFFIPYLW